MDLAVDSGHPDARSRHCAFNANARSSPPHLRFSRDRRRRPAERRWTAIDSEIVAAPLGYCKKAALAPASGREQRQDGSMGRFDSASNASDMDRRWISAQQRRSRTGRFEMLVAREGSGRSCVCSRACTSYFARYLGPTFPKGRGQTPRARFYDLTL